MRKGNLLMEKISIIVYCYNEEKTIPLFYEEMERVISKDFADFLLLLISLKTEKISTPSVVSK